VSSMNTTGKAASVPPEDVVEYLTAKEAAGLIGMSVNALVDLARAFQVPALWCLVDGAEEPEPLFTVRHARRIAEAQSKADDDTRPLVLPVFNLVRAFVDARPPTTAHVDALNGDRPFLARAGSKWGKLHAHVRPEALAMFAVESDADVRLRSKVVISSLLPLIHAKEITSGLRDGDGVRVSRVWWRVPLTIVDPNEGEQS
jgi:hypothetical protein